MPLSEGESNSLTPMPLSEGEGSDYFCGCLVVLRRLNVFRKK